MTAGLVASIPVSPAGSWPEVPASPDLVFTSDGSFVVPEVDCLAVRAVGARGGDGASAGASGGVGGNGADVRGFVQAVPGISVDVIVGGRGSDGAGGAGGGGGGASALLFAGTPFWIAGGGGGGGAAQGASAGGVGGSAGYTPTPGTSGAGGAATGGASGPGFAPPSAVGTGGAAGSNDGAGSAPTAGSTSVDALLAAGGVGGGGTSGGGSGGSGFGGGGGGGSGASGPGAGGGAGGSFMDPVLAPFAWGTILTSGTALPGGGGLVSVSFGRGRDCPSDSSLTIEKVVSGRAAAGTWFSVRVACTGGDFVPQLGGAGAEAVRDFDFVVTDDGDVRPVAGNTAFWGGPGGPPPAQCTVEEVATGDAQQVSYECPDPREGPTLLACPVRGPGPGPIPFNVAGAQLRTTITITNRFVSFTG